MKACLIIPFYNHGNAIAGVLDSLRTLAIPCFIVDDGSNLAAKTALSTAISSRQDPIVLISLPENRGKGVAVTTGFKAALAAGFTHAVQIDADGQHCVGDIPRMLQEAVRNPRAVING